VGDGLEGVRLKLRRADEHLEELKGHIAHYSEIRPYEAVRDFEFNPNAYVFRAHLREQPDPWIAVIFGDFIHNLRSVLDHLATAIVPDERKRKAAFPVLNIDPWETDLNTGGYFMDRKAARQQWSSSTKGMPEDAKALIKAVQPYHFRDDPEPSKLAIISSLDNTDKHQTLNVMSLGVRAPQTTVVYLDADGQPLTMFNQWHGGITYQDGAVVSSFPMEAGDTSAEVQVHIQGAVEVAVQVPGASGYYEIPTIPEILREFVVALIAALSPFVPAG
jgi:hypothetical protein